VELVNLDPVAFDPLELLVFLSPLIIYPALVIFLKNGVQESFVLFESVELILILINL
jgi:hypothetical protein